MQETAMGSDTEIPEPKQNNVSKPDDKAKATPDKPREIGGQKGPEPTRFGDWEKNGRCTDF